ncbi:MAG: SDR family oxidoreductase [Bacteroidota bacterium]
MTKTILITGSNGMLGQKCIYQLLKQTDVRIIATSIGANRTSEKNGYIYESLDITNEQEVQNIFEKYQPDAVINTAAFTNVDACEKDHKGCDTLNVDAVAYLLTACEKHNTHLVHLSTDFVFDGEHGPYKETDAPNPLSYYAESKFKAELLIEMSDIKWTIIRTIIIFGVVDDGNRSNVVLWVKNNLEKGLDINVINDQYRAPTLAEDLADACVSAVLKGATGIYHVSGKEIYCILDIAYMVADFFGLDKAHIKPITSASLKQPAMRPPRTGFIIDKAMKELDFHPHTFEESLEIIKQQLAQINK